MSMMKPVRGRLARALLGALLGIAGLGATGPLPAAAAGPETVTVTIRCDERGTPLREAQWSRPSLTAGRDRGRGWLYQWACLTFRAGDGKEQHRVWIDFKQWGGSSINLEVVSPVDAQLRWGRYARAPRLG